MMIFRIVNKAPVRIERTHKGFADLSLTAWVRRLDMYFEYNKKWSNLSTPAQAAHLLFRMY